MPELIVSDGKKVYFKVPLVKEKFLIGRSSTCDLTLPDDAISRKHAEIFFKDGAYYLMHHGSTATVLDHQEMVEGVMHALPLEKKQSKIKIGSWDIQFNLSAVNDHEFAENVQTCITQVKKDPPTKIIKLDAQKESFIIDEPSLLVNAAGQSNKHCLLKQKVNVIGSHPECDVVIHDDYVSGKHCQISIAEDAIVLKDLGSTNGTFLGNTRIDASPLTPDQTFKIGQTFLTLQTKVIEEPIQPLAAIQDGFCGIIGRHNLMQRLFAKIERVAPTKHTILICGPSGSGKELVARAIHELSGRNKNAYVILNCGAISAQLIESELFGHEKGAFTGAHARRIGAFEQANGGTLFLDEIGEMPLDMQAKLLRVLENKTIRRVGGDSEISVNVRVIAATHRDLAEWVKQGNLRQDLYFRLCVIPLSIPALSERREDIPLLVHYFLKQSMPEQREGQYSTANLVAVDAVPLLSKNALDKLINYSWPGNVRELKNVLLRGLIFSDGNKIDENDIEFLEKSEKTDHVNLIALEKDTIVEALEKAAKNKTKAAQMLGIAKSTLFKKIKHYGLAG